jgi:hypothetical protein
MSDDRTAGKDAINDGAANESPKTASRDSIDATGFHTRLHGRLQDHCVDLCRNNIADRVDEADEDSLRFVVKRSDRKATERACFNGSLAAHGS